MSEPSIRLIQAVVCEHYGVTVNDVLSRRRSTAVPSMVVAHLACRLTGHTASTIGRILARNHATIIHADQRVEALAAADPVLAGDLAALSVAALATAAAIEGARIAAADHDAVVIAEAVVASRRAATSLSVDEIRALAAAVLAGRDAETSNEEMAEC